MTFGSDHKRHNGTRRPRPACTGEASRDIRHSLIGLDERDRWRSALAGMPHGFGHTWESCHAFSLTTDLPTYLYLAECPEGRVVCPLMERGINGAVDVATPFGFSGFAGRGQIANFAEQWRAFASRERWVCAYVGQNPLFRLDGLFVEEAFEPAQNLYWLTHRRSGCTSPRPLAPPKTTAQTMAHPGLAVYGSRCAPPFRPRVRGRVLPAGRGSSELFPVGSDVAGVGSQRPRWS